MASRNPVGALAASPTCEIPANSFTIWSCLVSIACKPCFAAAGSVSLKSIRDCLSFNKSAARPMAFLKAAWPFKSLLKRSRSVFHWLPSLSSYSLFLAGDTAGSSGYSSVSLRAASKATKPLPNDCSDCSSCWTAGTKVPVRYCAIRVLSSASFAGSAAASSWASA